jgi:pyruvate dehydrogenase E1 component beta subunit
MAVTTMVEAIRATLQAEMAADDRTILLGQDIGRNGGVFRATNGLQEQFGSDRVVDTPLAEGAIIGAAIGLAISGMKPVAEIQFLPFAHQAYHQITDQLARFSFRSSGRFSMPVVVRAPFGGLVRTPELHSDSIEAHFVHCPGLKVVTPATARDAAGLLRMAIRDPDPVLFCEPLRGYRLIADEVPIQDECIPFGHARVARAGTDVVIIAWSSAVHVALQAAERLSERGLSASVLDLRTLVPFDTETLTNAVESTGRAVVVHEAPLTGAFGAEVVATIQEQCFYSLQAPIVRVAAPDTPYPLGALEEYYVPSIDRVVEAVMSCMTV